MKLRQRHSQHRRKHNSKEEKMEFKEVIRKRFSSKPQGRRLPLQRSKRERNARKCGVFSVFHIDILIDI